MITLLPWKPQISEKYYFFSINTLIKLHLANSLVLSLPGILLLMLIFCNVISYMFYPKQKIIICE